MRTSVPSAPKGPNLPEWEYTVYVLSVSEPVVEPVKGVIAAYFQEQGALLLFKDADHTVVEAFRTDLVTRIVRGDEPLDDAEV